MQVNELYKLDDDALGAVLAESFDSLPEPSASSLRKIRDQLPLSSQVKQPNRWAQLILIGILSGSGLAVAWWGVDRLFNTSVPVNQPANTITEPSTSLLQQDPAKSHSEQPGVSSKGDDRRSPVIFQREAY